MTVKALYEEHVLPHLINCTCSSPSVMPYRKEIVAMAYGDVLEIGMGSGINLPLYDAHKVSKVWGLEPSAGMRKKAQRNIAMSCVPLEWLDLPSERIPLADNSVDSIVLCFTLCTITDWKVALKQMHRVLKPEGKLFFCEHGLSPDNRVRLTQNTLNPIWKQFAGGCNLNRPVIKNISSGGFDINWHKDIYLPKAPKFGGYVSYGEATKQEPTSN